MSVTSEQLFDFIKECSEIRTRVDENGDRVSLGSALTDDALANALETVARLSQGEDQVVLTKNQQQLERENFEYQRAKAAGRPWDDGGGSGGIGDVGAH